MYQPLSGLHDPIVVDIQQPNFTDVRLTIRCERGDLLSAQEASVLCDRLDALFTNQGAQVTTLSASSLALPGDDFGAQQAQAVDAPAPTDLTITITSREVGTSDNPFLWTASAATFTLVPAVTETTFAQDVTVRDDSGFLLARDSLQGRIIRRFGAGVWATNAVMNRLFREDDEDITEEAIKAELSADMYQQLSQIVFNAKMRWVVLQDASPTAPGAAW